MLHVDRILYPTDGSACAEQAHHHAQHLAAHFDAALHVISVEERESALEVIEVKEAHLRADLHGVEEGEGPLPSARFRERTVTHPTAAGGILNYAVPPDVFPLVLGTPGH